MGYKEYKPDSTEKIVVAEIDMEVHQFTDGENIYWCGKCGEACPVQFYYINDCALCSEACKNKYIDDFRESQEGEEVKAMQKELDDAIAEEIANGGEVVQLPGGQTAVRINPKTFLGGGKKSKAKRAKKPTKKTP